MKHHIPRARKSAALRLAATTAHKRRLASRGRPLVCSVCQSPLIDSHHMRPVAAGGLSCDSNMILLCPNHHRLADRIARENPGFVCGEVMLVSLIRQLEARMLASTPSNHG